MAHGSDPLKEKFRPDESALDRQLDEALAGVSLDAMIDKATTRAASAPGEAPTVPGGKGPRRGKIVSVTKDDVFVDVEGKSPGVVPITQFEDIEPAVGMEMEFFVDRYDAREGILLLNRKGATAQNVSWENLAPGQVIEAMVTGMNKGGLELEIRGMRAFMPSGQVDLYFMKDISVFLGQKLRVEVVQCDPQRKNLVVSRRHILEKEKEEAKVKLVAELDEGQIRRGVVRNVTEFGAFIDLGGADGLLHVREMSFRRNARPSDIVKIGDALDVKIIRFDRESGKISLSLNQARGVDPWADAATRYAPGTQVTGRVVKLESFGVFVEVEEGLEGLLPLSEMSWKRIRQASEVVKEGDTVSLVVLSLDPTARRVSFSMKQASPDPWAGVPDRFPRGAVVAGKITRLAEFGAFVEVEPGLEGLVHISELSNKRVATVGDAVAPGQDVQVKVIEVDPENRRLSLSIRRAAEGMTAAQAPVASASPAAPAAPKKKRPELRGGLEW